MFIPTHLQQGAFNLLQFCVGNQRIINQSNYNVNAPIFWECRQGNSFDQSFDCQDLFVKQKTQKYSLFSSICSIIFQSHYFENKQSLNEFIDKKKNQNSNPLSKRKKHILNSKIEHCQTKINQNRYVTEKQLYYNKKIQQNKREKQNGNKYITIKNSNKEFSINRQINQIYIPNNVKFSSSMQKMIQQKSKKLNKTISIPTLQFSKKCLTVGNEQEHRQQRNQVLQYKKKIIHNFFRKKQTLVSKSSRSYFSNELVKMQREQSPKRKLYIS